MWQSRPAAFRRSRSLLLQLFHSRGGGGGATSLGLAGGASSVCPSPSRALIRYSSSEASSPFSEIYHSVYSSYDLLFITRTKVEEEEDVVGGIGKAECHQEEEEDEDVVAGGGIDMLSFFSERDDDPAASMAQFALEVCSNKTISLKSRREAVEIIRGLAWRKPDSLEKYELVNPILQAMFPLLVMPDSHAEVFSFVHTLGEPYRQAALHALGDIAKGCSEIMKDSMEPLLGIVLGAHRDPEPCVRECASLALQRFVDHLKPQIISQRQSVLPCLLDGLDDHDVIKKTSFESLESLCHCMTGEEILPYLDIIIDKLLGELQFGSRGRSFTSMCSVAAGAGQHFVPYAERVLEVLTRTGQHFLDQKCLVFAGLLVMTVGRAGVESMLGPYVEAAVSQAANSILCSSNCWFFHTRRRHTYGFFCTAAETLGDGFAKYLPRVVPLAISSCNLDEYLGATHPLPEILDEKAGATRALGLFAVHTKSAFEPYLEESVSLMINHSAHYHEDVRLQGVIGLKNILTAAAAVSDSPSDGAAKAKQVLGTVMDRYIKAMGEDGDKRVVAQVCANMVDILEDFGYAALEPYMRQVIDSALRLLQGQSACQRADDAEHDEALMAAVSNLLSALAKAPSMSSMLSDALVKLSAAPGSSQYRTKAAAIRAEVAHNLDASIPACPR